MNRRFLCAGDFQTLGNPSPGSQLGLLRGEFDSLQNLDILVVVKVRFQKEMLE